MSDGSIGRILIGWNKATIRLNVIADDSQYIHCDVKLVKENSSIGLTIVYGSNNPMERKVLWRNLINQAHMMQNTPWIIMGDFNTIKHPLEKVGGAAWGNYYCEDLSNCMRDAELDDLRFMGHLLTWSNCSEGARRIACKLDRALINDSWKDLFPNAMAHFFNPSISDHSPCLVRVGTIEDCRKVPFKFYNMWTHHENFLNVVAKVWNQEAQGSPMFIVTSKLKKLKVELKKFNKEHFGHISERVLEARRQLENVQELLWISPLDEDLARDQNTKFFFKSIKGRRNRNSIYGIQRENGTFVYGMEEVKEEFVDHFESVLNVREHSNVNLEQLKKVVNH
ncbi:uncharacterized protein LOC123200909 [Mangifera indica]|uniref:uncharacterized protein LOC123200909 n=1 Tax=Mangifera indica TaxID=29780 RepID=UPI001CFBC637|nr:uncharacterized protein LOC123200909 [Mangifera indica]